MQFPNDTDVQLIVCDDIRLELNNKISILGFLPGGNISINFPDQSNEIVLPGLAFLFLIEGGEGIFDAKLRFISPSGAVVFEDNIQPVEKKPDIPAIAAFKFAGFQIKEVGKFRAEIILNNRVYHKIFTCIRGAGAAASVTT